MIDRCTIWQENYTHTKILTGCGSVTSITWTSWKISCTHIVEYTKTLKRNSYSKHKPYYNYHQLNNTDKEK